MTSQYLFSRLPVTTYSWLEICHPKRRARSPVPLVCCSDGVEIPVVAVARRRRPEVAAGAVTSARICSGGRRPWLRRRPQGMSCRRGRGRKGRGEVESCRHQPGPLHGDGGCRHRDRGRREGRFVFVSVYPCPVLLSVTYAPSWAHLSVNLWVW